MRFSCFLHLLLGLSLVLGWKARAQGGFDPRSAVPPDSLRAAEGNFAPRPDSLRRRFDEEAFRLRLERYAQRKTIAGRAVGALFNLTRPQTEQAGLDAELLNRQFDQHNFKIVRRVDIRPLDAFGYSLSDSLRRPRTFWERAGNAVHVRTARARIRQVLLFRPGRPLAPQALAESERLLRQTPEILDARVVVNEKTTTRDSVDLLVLTTDVFSVTAGFELGGASAGVAAVGDQNFLGLGHQLDNRYQYGRDQPQSWSYEGSYQVPFREFVYARARYQNEFQYRSGGVSVRRDFFSPSTRYAGAFSFDVFNQGIVPPDAPAPPDGQLPKYQPLRHTNTDLWVGRALHLRSYDLGFENPGRVIVAGRVFNQHYGTRPTADYRSTTLLLGTLGYSVRRYYKDQYLFGFGRTEDVPTGTLLSLTTGFDSNSGLPRRYLDARVAAAGYSLRRGFLYGSVDFGSFQRLDTKAWEQGLLSTETLYFTRRFRTGAYQWRHLLSTRATVGFNRRPNELLYSGVTDGPGSLRGFRPGGALRTTSRFLVNYEANLYTPLSLLGFRVAGILFADAAWISERTGGGTPFGYTAPYTGFGLGLRLRNEFTALRTFQLLLGFYPRGQLTPNGLRLFETSRDAYQFSDFSFGQPNVVQYQ